MNRETFVFEPTAGDVAREKQTKQTLNQLAKEFKRQYEISMRSATLGKQTAGGQLINFKKTARVCELYGQPIPDDLKCLIALYEKAEADSIRAACWEEENPLMRYPRPSRETVVQPAASEKKAKRKAKRKKAATR